jgi:hypothetical protein
MCRFPADYAIAVTLSPKRGVLDLDDALSYYTDIA